MRRVQVAPELADVDSLLKQWEEAIAHLPQLMQLAGAVLLRLAEMGATRVEVLISEGEAAYRDPIVQQGVFSEVVR